MSTKSRTYTIERRDHRWWATASETDMAIKWNPHFVAYAKSQGCLPKEIPAGSNAGFIVWMSQRRRDFMTQHPECVLGDRIIDRAAWTEYLATL